jgi:hypothetical protein
MIECNHLFLNISVALQTVFVAHVCLTEGQRLCEEASVNRGRTQMPSGSSKKGKTQNRYTRSISVASYWLKNGKLCNI